MKVLKNKKENYTVSLEVETDYADIEKAQEPAFQELVKDAKVPGFRPGKVPRNVFEQHYGTEMIINRASLLVMNDCYKQIIEQEKLEPVDYPQNIDIKTLESGKPFVFTLTVDVKPEVKPHKYKGLKVTKESTEVSKAELQAELDRMREYYAEYKDVQRPIKQDDLVGFAQKAFDGDKPVEEWTKEKTGTRVGANFIAEDFDKALVGMKLNESKTFTVKIKPDYFMKNVAGKEIRFEVLVTEIKERNLPELNDEFAKKASGKETLAALEKDVQEHLEKNKKSQTETKFKNDLIEELLKENEFPLPSALVEAKLHQMLEELRTSLQQKNMEIGKYLQLIGRTQEQISQEYKPVAEKRARVDLLLEVIAAKEEIKPTDEEYAAEIEKIIKSNRKESPTPEELEKLKKNIPEYTKQYILRYLTEEKTMDFLTNNAKIKE